MTLSAVDAARARKPVKTLFGWLLFRRMSLPLALWLAPRRVRPSYVTALGLALGLVGAGLLAYGSYWLVVAGAVLANIAKLLDAVDGELARATHSDTSAGYVADGLCDRLRDTAVIIGAGFGAFRADEAHALVWTIFAVAGYLAFFYVSAAAPSHWREIRSEDELEQKHAFRVAGGVRLGAGDTLAVLVLACAILGRMELLVQAIALTAPLAVAVKVRRLFALRPWAQDS